MLSWCLTIDKEFLQDYDAKETEEYERLVVRQVKNFDFSAIKYPPDNRFFKLHNLVTDSSLLDCGAENRWAQVPFSGSTIFNIQAMSQKLFESQYFDVSKIPQVIDFIKETGRVQIALLEPAINYAGIDYLDPIFKELKPPCIKGIPISATLSEEEFRKHSFEFYELANIRFFKGFNELIKDTPAFQNGSDFYIDGICSSYIFMKSHYPELAEQFEDLMIDDPIQALAFIFTCNNFIMDPRINLRFDVLTYSLREIKGSSLLPPRYRPTAPQFPTEIGKFLFTKLTYAPVGLRACNSIIDHYSQYDLQKLILTLNEAITSNKPDVVNKTSEEISAILDDVWKDKTIMNRIKGLKAGLPLSMVALGEIIAGPIGAAGGFLAGLGYKLVDKTVNMGNDSISQKVGKWKSKSYQSNIYDFKQKYKDRIVLDE